MQSIPFVVGFERPKRAAARTRSYAPQEGRRKTELFSFRSGNDVLRSTNEGKQAQQV